MMKHLLHGKAVPALFTLFSFFFGTLNGYSQLTWQCTNELLLTRQVSGNTPVDNITFTSNDINFATKATVASQLLNGSVYYGGYVWAMGNSPASNILKRISNNGTVTNYTITNLPSSSWNNAGVTKDGRMYLLQNGSFSLWAIDLATQAIVDLDPGSANFFRTISFSGSTPGPAADATYGDIVVDPATAQVYFWIHPNPAAKPAGAVYGLYILNTTSNVATSVGYDASNVMGSLFFDDAGRLFGYGSVPRTAIPQTVNQDRFFFIDKSTGYPIQYGTPDLAVSQSDGCNCAFRLSVDLTTSLPSLNVPRCANADFQYIFTIKNYTTATQNAITLSHTLDTRLSYTFNVTALQTQLRSFYGNGATVTLSNSGGGTNNVLSITGMNIPVGGESFPVNVTVAGKNFPTSAIINTQATLGNITATNFPSTEPSENPVTYVPKDVTPISINVIDRLCGPPVADNFTNQPLSNGAAQTPIPSLTASDADGSIASYTIVTLPAASAGVLYVNGVAATAGQSLTPAQISQLTFDPVSGFTGMGQFTFKATDNSANESNTAIYQLPVTGTPPVANSILNRNLLNTAAATAIVPFSAADADGTIASYTIVTLPSATAGILYVNGVAATAGQTITPAQISQLSFDPINTFTGNASFTYRATDNSGSVSNTADFTVPVSATTATQYPPLANNIEAQTITNNEAAIAIPAFSAADADGTIASYTIVTLPSASAGILYVNGVAATAGQTITPAQISQLSFDPINTFTGNASFTYRATDNGGLTSGVAAYRIPVINRPPTATNVIAEVSFNAIEAVLPAIGGSDLDGTVTAFTITSLPASGTLRLCTPTCSNVVLNQVITSANIANLKFTPATGFTGNTSFTYIATDNSNLTSAAATYTITILNQPPVANDVVNTTLANTAAATTVSSLSASDPDGSIASYTIQSLPLASQGVLALGGTAVTVGQVITTAQATQLQFDPTTAYAGVSGFTYSATDNSGNVSNVANFNIPVSGTANIPPIARSVTTAALAGTAASTAISAFVGSDPDGTVASYTIRSLPSAASGVLYVNGIAATRGQVLTVAQAAQLQFDPAAGFEGTASFTFSNTDNATAVSNLATYTIPITNLPPVARPVVASAMLNTNSATTIPVLSANDPDGTIASYTIENLPPATQGVLSINGVAVAAGQVLTVAEAAQLQFDPSGTYVGDVVFNYHATDNSSAVSNSATYTIPVSNRPPLAQSVFNAALISSAGAVAILPLSAADVDGGTIASYTILNLPPAGQGVLSINGVAVTAGQVLTPAQALQLRFDPAAGYSGAAIFNYSAVDNSGLVSNIATYVIPLITGDNDNDGVTDEIDIDDDNDGVTDNIESNSVDATGDADGDGTLNYRDITPGASLPSADTNGDGIVDAYDTDLDGIINQFDLDSDNDGIADLVEAGGVDVNGDGRIDGAFADSDNDGLMNAYDDAGGNAIANLDTDSDGIRNFVDLDSDGDGVPDILEAGGVDTNNNGQVDVFADSDSDGFTNGYDGDANNDGTAENTNNALIITGSDGNNDGRPDSYPRSNTDRIALPNAYDLDADGDGILDARESGLGVDTNNDGIADGTAGTDGWNDAVDLVAGPLNLTNTDSRGPADYLDIDSDDDGLSDNIEGQSTGAYLLPAGADSDGDGIDNAYDNNDAAFGGNANNGLTPYNFDGTDNPDYTDENSDNDAKPDLTEINGDPSLMLTNIADTDDDGLVDQFDSFSLLAENTALQNNVLSSGMGAGGSPGGPTPSGTTSLATKTGASSADRDWRNNLVALPVNFISVNAQLQQNGTLINWVVADERSVSHYEVERSTDGSRFSKIGAVPFAASSNAVNEYQFSDNTPVTQKTYFRIREVDIDGRATYSQIVSVNSGQAVKAVSIFPNPVNAASVLQITADRTQTATVHIVTVAGKLVYGKKLDVQKGQNSFRLEAPSVPGTYMVIVYMGNETYKIKIVK